MSNPIARMLSRRSSRLQNTSFDETERLEGRPSREESERFILSRTEEKRSGPALPFTRPFTSSSSTIDSPSTPSAAGASARDCSASSSVSMSYDDVSSGSVAKSLVDWLESENERDDSDDDDNESVPLLLRAVRADRKAQPSFEERDDVIGGDGRLLLPRDGFIVKEEETVARSAAVSDDRGGIDRAMVGMIE
mmetsp:Transcript_21994/g.47171  ORF Transcript_21994/g.47171 Transcript_21994/m.47171 type:complete len:193 (-) Transcript_21994:63-641(-)